MGAVVDDDDADDAVANPLMERLQEAADEAGIDVDDFDTWKDVGEFLDNQDGEDGAEAEAEASDEEAEDDSEEATFSAEDLKAKPIGEIRALARDNGISTAGLNKAALIDALTGQDDF